MITVVKGSSKLLVTRGTYEEQLKPLGYRIASENEGAAKKVAPLLNKKEEENQEDFSEKEKEDLNEKFGLKDRKNNTTKKGK